MEGAGGESLVLRERVGGTAEGVGGGGGIGCVEGGGGDVCGEIEKRRGGGGFEGF